MFKIDERYSDYYDGTDLTKYPGGKAVNSSGVDTTDGTPWLAKMFNNTVGWMQALVIKAWGNLNGISGEPENVQRSDVVDALEKIRTDNNASEREISESTYFKKSGGTIDGDATVTGGLHVKGDLVVDGTGEEIISTALKVGADTITLRDGNPTGLTARELAGVVTENYDGQGNNSILAVDAGGNARVGDIDIAKRFLYSSDGTSFFTDEEMTVPATIGQDEIVRDTGNTTSGGAKIYEGTTFSNDRTQPLATRDDAENMADGYGVTWDAASNSLKTTFLPSGRVVPTKVDGDTAVSSVAADRSFYITANSACTLTLGDAVEVGLRVRVINTTSLTHTLSCTSVSVNVPKILPMANFEIMWNGSAWQNVGGCAVGETFEQKPQCDSPFDVYPCSAWTELVSHNGAFYRSANAPTTLYTLDGVTFYADIERLNPVDWSGIKNSDGTAGTVTDTGNTQYNSRGEQMKIYTGSWTSGNAAAYIDKTGNLVSQGDSIRAQSVTVNGTTAGGGSHTHGLRCFARNSTWDSDHMYSYNGNGGNAGLNWGGSNPSENNDVDFMPMSGRDVQAEQIPGLQGNSSTLFSTGFVSLLKNGRRIISIVQDHIHQFSANATIGNGNETRPENYSVRVWKRTA